MDMPDDEAQIGAVLIRYATGIDRRDWALFRTCWTHDVRADYGELGQFDGVDALTDLMTTIHQNMGPTYHRMSNFAIDIGSDDPDDPDDTDHAKVRSYVHAVLMVTPDDPSVWVDAIGHYDDEFCRTADGWRISRRVWHPGRMLTSGG
jgi:SnoaL-like domain